MNPTQRKTSRNNSIENLDGGITVKKALALISNSEYYNDIYKSFNIKDIEDEFIEINGAEKVVLELIETDEECVKLDIDTKLKDVSVDKFTEEHQVIFEILNIKDVEILKITKNDIIYPQSIYSVKTDYLNEMFKVEKYLDFCLKSGYHDIVDINLKMLKDKNKANEHLKKFRLLKSKDGKYYARGITSVGVYRDYNLRMSLFIALIEIHKLIKNKGQSYYISSYSFNESDLKVTFKSSILEKVSSNMNIGFALELINDEIRRDAVKFNGIFTIQTGDAEIIVRPEETKANILSFTHSMKIETLKEKAKGLNELIKRFLDNTIEDAKRIKIIEKPDLFREYLLYSISSSKNGEFNKIYKGQIASMLAVRVNTIFQLSAIFDKIELLISDEHVSSIDFWRNKLYNILMEKTRNKK